MKLIAVLLGAAGCSLLHWPTACAQAPVNDHFTNRIQFSGNSFTLIGNTTNATVEPSEQRLWAWSPPYNSVWYSWTPSQSALVVAEILIQIPSSLPFGDQQLGIFPGLTPDFSTYPTTNSTLCRLTPFGQSFPFFVEAGTSCAIGVAGWLPLYQLNFTSYSTNSPVILEHPLSRTNPAGSSVLLSALAGGISPGQPFFSPPLVATLLKGTNWQWYHDRVPIAGGNWHYLSIPELKAADAGDYHAVVTNWFTGGTATTAVAHLTIFPTNFAGSLPAPSFSAPRKFQPFPGNPSNYWFDYYLRGDTNHCYVLEFSYDLKSWFDFQKTLTPDWPPDVQPFIPLRDASGVLLEHPVLPKNTFYRAYRLASNRAICRSQLQQLEHAKRLWAFEMKQTTWDTPAAMDLIGTDRYVKLRFGNTGPYMTPQCPANGYYTVGNMTTQPFCSVIGHSLE